MTSTSSNSFHLFPDFNVVEGEPIASVRFFLPRFTSAQRLMLDMDLLAAHGLQYRISGQAEGVLDFEIFDFDSRASAEIFTRIMRSLRITPEFGNPNMPVEMTANLFVYREGREETFNYDFSYAPAEIPIVRSAPRVYDSKHGQNWILNPNGRDIPLFANLALTDTDSPTIMQVEVNLTHLLSIGGEVFWNADMAYRLGLFIDTVHLNGQTKLKIQSIGNASMNEMDTFLQSISYRLPTGNRLQTTHTISLRVWDELEGTSMTIYTLTVTQQDNEAPRAFNRNPDYVARHVEDGFTALPLAEIGFSDNLSEIWETHIRLVDPLPGDWIDFLLPPDFLRSRNLQHLYFVNEYGVDGRANAITIRGQASAASYQELVRMLHYRSYDDDPTRLSADVQRPRRTIAVRPRDQHNWGEETFFNVEIDSRNDAARMRSEWRDAERPVRTLAHQSTGAALFPDLELIDPDSRSYRAEVTIENFNPDMQSLRINHALIQSLGFTLDINASSWRQRSIALQATRDDIPLDNLVLALRSIEIIAQRGMAAHDQRVRLTLYEQNFSDDAVDAGTILFHEMAYQLEWRPNRPPMFLDGPSSAVSMGGAAVVLDSDLTLRDDHPIPQAYAAWVKIDNPAAGDTLSVVGSSVGFNIDYQAHLGLLWITGLHSIADYEALLERVSFSTQATVVHGTMRQINFSVFDGSDWGPHHRVELNIYW